MQRITQRALNAALITLVLLLFFATTPGLAVCSSAFALPTPGYIRIPGSTIYGPAAVPSFTPNAKITFWSLTTGEAALLAGDDSGAYTVYLRNSGGGQAILPYDYSTGVAMVNDGPGPFYNYAMTFSTNWAASALMDGCVANIPDTADRCTCVLYQDAWQGTGYAAILSAQANVVGDFSWVGAEVGNLPRVRINNSMRVGQEIQAGVNIDNLTAGLNNGPGCDCGPKGYRIYSKAVPAASGAPLDRRISTGGWVLEASGIVGAADVNIPVDCGNPDTDLYLAASLTWDGGFETELVSANSTRISCVPNLADPVERIDLTRPSQRPSGPDRRGSRSRR